MDIINTDDLERLMIKAKKQNDFLKLMNESPDKAIECAISVHMGSYSMEYANKNHLFEIIEYIYPSLSYEELASLLGCYENLVTTIIHICGKKGIKTVKDCQKLYEKIIKEKGSNIDE